MYISSAAAITFFEQIGLTVTLFNSRHNKLLNIPFYAPVASPQLQLQRISVYMLIYIYVRIISYTHRCRLVFVYDQKLGPTLRYYFFSSLFLKFIPVISKRLERVQHVADDNKISWNVSSKLLNRRARTHQRGSLTLSNVIIFYGSHLAKQWKLKKNSFLSEN